MAKLKESVTNEELLGITTPSVLNMMRTIKQIQKRMNDPDLKNLEYPRVYDTLSKEFDDFFNTNTSIFIKVTRGEDLSILASALYYKDQVERGLMKEAQVADLVASRYMPGHLKKESDIRLKEMKEKGEI